LRHLSQLGTSKGLVMALRAGSWLDVIG
jgi:hypothetical protein